MGLALIIMMTGMFLAVFVAVAPLSIFGYGFPQPNTYILSGVILTISAVLALLTLKRGKKTPLLR